MATKVKKSRDRKVMNREINQALFSDVERMEMVLTDNWKKLVIGVVVAAVVVTAGFAVWHLRTSAARKAAHALADAENVIELQKTLEKYPSEPGSPAARFRLAGLLIDNGDFDGALGELRQISSASSVDPSMVAKAKLTEGYVLEAKQDLTAAAECFAALGRDAGAGIDIRCEANYAAGRLLAQLKRLDEAVAVLETAAGTVSERRSAMQWSGNARALLASIESGAFGTREPAAVGN